MALIRSILIALFIPMALTCNKNLLNTPTTVLPPSSSTSHTTYTPSASYGEENYRGPTSEYHYSPSRRKPSRTADANRTDQYKLPEKLVKEAKQIMDTLDDLHHKTSEIINDLEQINIR